MSVFYATIQGNRGPATRQGSAASGIKVAAQSYDGSVITSLSYDHDDRLMVRVSVSDESSSYGDTIFRGTFGEFKQKLQSTK